MVAADSFSALFVDGLQEVDLVMLFNTLIRFDEYVDAEVEFAFNSATVGQDGRDCMLLTTLASRSFPGLPENKHILHCKLHLDTAF